MARKTELRIILLVASVLLTLALVEIFSRVYLQYLANPQQFNLWASVNQLVARYGQDQASQQIFEPHRNIGYIPTPGYRDRKNRHNEDGYRGDELTKPKPEETFRIVALGGSTTYSVSVNDYHHSYPYLLGEYLREAGYPNVEVINAGASYYSSLESLINLQTRVLELDPDMILVYHGINDVHPRLVWPQEAFRADNSGACQLRLQRLRMPSIFEYSTFLRILGIQLGFFQTHAQMDWQFMFRPPTFLADDFLEQKRSGTYPNGIFTSISARQILEANDTRYFEGNLRSMVAIARSREIEPMLMTFAYSPLYDEEDFPRVASPEYQLAYEQQNAMIRRLAEETETLCFDLEAVMPDDTQYYTDGRHYTEAGNRLRAQLIGDFILASGVLDR